MFYSFFGFLRPFVGVLAFISLFPVGVVICDILGIVDWIIAQRQYVMNVSAILISFLSILTATRPRKDLQEGSQLVVKLVTQEDLMGKNNYGKH
jgi:hypothetical protein